MNLLYYGDNLTFCGMRSSPRASISSTSTRRSTAKPRTTCCSEARRREARAQIEAFEDTWHWDDEAELASMV